MVVGARGVRTDLLVAAVALVNTGMMLDNGRYDVVALVLVIAGAAALLAAFAAQRQPHPVAVEQRVVAAFALQAIALLLSSSRHIIDLSRAGEGLLAVLVAGGALVLVFGGIDAVRRSPRWVTRPLPVLALAATVMIGAVVVGLGPVLNDVYYLQTIGVERLFDGISPYAPGYPDIYAPADSLRYYGPELSVDGVLQFGYAYPPVTLLMAVPGWLLGDVRVSHLLAVLLTAVLLQRIGPGRRGRLAATLYLAGAPLLFVVTQSWTEPFVVLLLTTFVLAQRRWPGSGRAGAALGLFLTAKQYGLLFAPLPMLLVGRPVNWRSVGRLAGAAAAAALVVAAPFLIWDPGGVRTSMIDHLLSLPVRHDALSLLARTDLGGFEILVTVVAAAGALAAIWRYAPRTEAGFAGSVAFVLLVTVLFVKQAFANYYFTVSGAALVAVAAGGSDVDAPPRNSR